MKIFGKSLPEYVSFEKGFLILILVVGLARLGLSLAGAPDATVKFASMTVLMLLGLIYYSVTVHTSGFGSYKQLLPVLALPVILMNVITISAIVLAIETGRDNIFTDPEFSPRGANGRTWGHVGAHLIAMIVLPFLLWGIGALIMLLTKKLTGSRQPKTGTAGA
jgi:magnesium-transporting ATPase (P-type)